MEVIGGNKNCGLQRRNARCDSWTMTKRAAFLSTLEATCNVTRACTAATMSKSAAYNLRRRDPVFAAAWATALEQGCENLRALLLARALGTADPELIADNPGPDDRAVPESEPMSDDTRIKVLQICRAAADGRQGRGDWRKPRARVMSGEEAFAVLSDKLDRMEKKLKRDGQA